ncbi:hypothetical protein ABZW30_16355 [Kitasatospora sp. NPDC004669]|uniref:hypothetical protein n=1 Tax=Kitasatospora sp. NPDC004669 TaxID=3154555 RepID=UPI0033A39705
MGFVAMWILMPLPAAEAERFLPQLFPPPQSDPPDFCPLDDRIETLYELWEICQHAGPWVSVSALSRYPIHGLADALGPERFARLPPGLEAFQLDPAAVRASLPAVEAVFTMDEATRAEAGERLWIALDGSREPDLLDGVLPVWRAAVEAGHGLIGAQVVPT